MFKIGDYVIYKREVCKISDIKNNKFTNLECYVLNPISDDSLKINVPINNKEDLRSIMTKEEINKLIQEIPKIEPIKIDSHSIDHVYKDLFHSKKHEDLIKIIKTTYLKNEERTKENRSIGQKDKEYFDKAEKYLYNEIAVALNISFDDAKEYVIKKVNENEKNS